MGNLEALVHEPKTISLEELEAQGVTPVRWDTKGGNIIFEYTAQDKQEPLMLEIGGQREQTFRDAGGGTGKKVDIDKFDVGRNAYTQIFVYDPEEEVIAGGYRYKKLKDVKGTLRFNLASTRLFKFSRKFKKEYKVDVVELGRSYITANNQAAMNRQKPILPALLKGLGSIVARDEGIDYFFGKVTMYKDRTYPGTRDLILHFLDKYYADKEGLVRPRRSNGISTNEHYLDELLGEGENMFRNLNKAINKMKGEMTEEQKKVFTMGFPPLLKSYIKLVEFDPDKFPTFGAAMNRFFGGVEEIGIMIKKGDINEKDTAEYIGSYEANKIRSYDEIYQELGKN